MTKSRPLPPFEEVDRLLRYEPETGKIYWKVKRCNNAKEGAEAGSVHRYKHTSYLDIKINDITFKAHRVAWYLHYREDPGGRKIDHINHNGLDNRIKNLRVATCAQNQHNRKINKTSSTGYKGVTKSKEYKRRFYPYIAVAQINGKRAYLGGFRTPEEASEAYQRFCKEHHGEFYNE